MQSRGWRLLLVDDNADTVAVMHRILALDGHEVHHASTAAEALSQCVREPIDLVISDIGLPDTDGYELMRSLLKECHVKGIALSGYAMAEDVKRAVDAGFSAHLAKPVSIQTLRDAIERVMG